MWWSGSEEQSGNGDADRALMAGRPRYGRLLRGVPRGYMRMEAGGGGLGVSPILPLVHGHPSLKERPRPFPLPHLHPSLPLCPAVTRNTLGVRPLPRRRRSSRSPDHVPQISRPLPAFIFPVNPHCKSLSETTYFHLLRASQLALSAAHSSSHPRTSRTTPPSAPASRILLNTSVIAIQHPYTHLFYTTSRPTGIHTP